MLMRIDLRHHIIQPSAHQPLARFICERFGYKIRSMPAPTGARSCVVLSTTAQALFRCTKKPIRKRSAWQIEPARHTRPKSSDAGKRRTRQKISAFDCSVLHRNLWHGNVSTRQELERGIPFAEGLSRIVRIRLLGSWRSSPFPALDIWRQAKRSRSFRTQRWLGQRRLSFERRDPERCNIKD